MRLKPPFALPLLTVLLISASLSVRSGSETSLLRSSNSFFITQNEEGTTVSITGKIKTTQGRPIKGAVVVIKDADTNEVVRSTFSSSFGFYKLEQIETGRTYVLSVTHRRYLFAFPAQLLEINEERTGVDFTGEAND